MIDRRNTWSVVVTALVVLPLLALPSACTTGDYGSAYAATPAGKAEIKTIPEARVLITEGEGGYFERSDELFMRLFRYIKKKEISMTVPVEARISPAGMIFYVGSADRKKADRNEGGVTVRTGAERRVASLGGRGAYTRKNFDEARAALETWLGEQRGYVADGEAYAVYWNGPFTPSFLKRFEVHIPVRSVEAAREPERESASESASESENESDKEPKGRIAS